MYALLLSVALLTLCVTHYMAYASGIRYADRYLYFRFHAPMRRSHDRFLRASSEAMLEDSASSQQRNLRLIAQNELLKGKALRYARSYRTAAKRLRVQRGIWGRLEGLLHVFAELDSARRK